MPTADTPPAPQLSIVVPTYNERTRIAELVEAVFSVFATHRLDGELVIVDDNSPDGTGAIVDGLCARHGGRLQVVHRSGKLGLGTAVMAGFLASRAPIVGVMDADFSHPPDVLPTLYRVLQELRVDAVVGSRYIAGGRVENWPFLRQLASKLACVMAWPLTPVRDATSGFFLIRRDVVEGVRIAAGGFKICLELLMRSPVQSGRRSALRFHRSNDWREQDDPARGDGIPHPAPPVVRRTVLWKRARTTPRIYAVHAVSPELKLGPTYKTRCSLIRTWARALARASD